MDEFNKIYETIFGSSPPKTTTTETSKAGILSKGRGFMSAFDYTMQLQVGCPGGCLFCYVPAADQLTSKAVKGEYGKNWGFLIKNKENVLQKLKRYLYSGELADKTIYWSGVTDPYASPPNITRGLWQILLSTPVQLRPRRIAVQTRFHPRRDAELMAKYRDSTLSSDGGPPILISYSIGTDRNDLIIAWEKSTPRFEHRLNNIKILREYGLFVVATLSPLGIWIQLKKTVEQFKDWDVSYLTCLFFKEDTPSANTSTLFLKYLREKYPAVLDPIWQIEQVEKMRQVYGHNQVIVGQPGFISLAQPHMIMRNSCTSE